MSGVRLLVDTNVLINFSEGKKELDLYLNENIVYVSVISEMELLGYTGISAKEIKFFQSLLSRVTIIDLINPIKVEVMKLRQANRIKLPDAIVAATAIYLGIPLLTLDKDFQIIKSLNLIIPEI